MKALRLIPRQDQFYTYLTDLCTKANLCAGFLKTYIEAPDLAAREKVRENIAACRAQSKAIMKNMTDELCRSFITPFDREDIQSFAQYLYRIPKIIEKVVQRMELHGLKGARADFCRQIDLIVEESRVMGETVTDLIHRNHTKQVMQKVTQLQELEQKGDDILQELLMSLFSEEHDVKDLILHKDIYDLLEKVIDCYRDAANVTLQIVLKYS